MGKKKFKINDEQSYTRTVLIDSEKKIGINKEFSIIDSIKEMVNNDEYNTIIIPLENIEFNPLNEQYRDMTTEEEIRELANSIALYGMMHNIVVKKSAEHPDKYTLISGEKRILALKLLKKEGINKYPGGIRANLIEKNLSLEEEEVLIHTANLMSRNFDQEVFIRLVIKYEELLKKATAETGEKIKNVNALIASISGKSERMVRRFRSIYKNLHPELLDAFMQGKLGQREAEEYMKLDDEGQKLVADSIKDNNKITFEEALAIREKQNGIQEVNTSENETIAKEEDNNKKNEEKEKNTVKNIDINLKDPNVKKRVLEREIEKLSKSIINSITKYKEKERTYKDNFGEFTSHYKSIQKMINELLDGEI